MSDSPNLTRAEDDELRRLNYMAQIGVLSGEKLERMIELSRRDRRRTVRAPREFEQEEAAETKRSGLRSLLSRI